MIYFFRLYITLYYKWTTTLTFGTKMNQFEAIYVHLYLKPYGLLHVPCRVLFKVYQHIHIVASLLFPARRLHLSSPSPIHKLDAK